MSYKDILLKKSLANCYFFIISITTDIVYIDIVAMDCLCQEKESKKELSNTIPLLKTIADENRLQILCFLKKKEKCVCDIVEFLQIPQNLVSHHLKILKKQNLVKTRKEGLWVFYSLNTKIVDTVKTLLNALL